MFLLSTYRLFLFQSLAKMIKKVISLVISLATFLSSSEAQPPSSTQSDVTIQGSSSSSDDLRLTSILWLRNDLIGLPGHFLQKRISSIFIEV